MPQAQSKKKSPAWPSEDERRSLARIFIAIGLCWMLAFGGIAIHAQLEADEGQQNLAAFDRNLTTATVPDKATTGIRLKQAQYQATERALTESLERRDLALLGLPVLPAGLSIAWAAILWVVPGVQARLRAMP